MALGKPSAVSIGAWIALIAITIYLIYAATHKEDSEIYSKGASKSETTYSVAPSQTLYPFSFGCAPMLKMTDPLGIKTPDAEKKGKK